MIRLSHWHSHEPSGIPTSGERSRNWTHLAFEHDGRLRAKSQRGKRVQLVARYAYDEGQQNPRKLDEEDSEMTEIVVHKTQRILLEWAADPPPLTPQPLGEVADIIWTPNNDSQSSCQRLRFGMNSGPWTDTPSKPEEVVPWFERQLNFTRRPVELKISRDNETQSWNAQTVEEVEFTVDIFGLKDQSSFSPGTPINPANCSEWQKLGSIGIDQLFCRLRIPDGIVQILPVSFDSERGSLGIAGKSFPMCSLLPVSNIKCIDKAGAEVQIKWDWPPDVACNVLLSIKHDATNELIYEKVISRKELQRRRDPIVIEKSTINRHAYDGKISIRIYSLEESEVDQVRSGVPPRMVDCAKATCTISPSL